MFPALLILLVPSLELQLRYPLLERQLSQQLFTQDGRKYVKGSPDKRCNFAYLANPRFASRDGQLLITAQFSGKSSFDLLGKCLGFSDSFEFEVLSGLTTEKGTLRLLNPQVRVLSRDTFYSRQVAKALQRSIADAIRYPIREEIQKLLVAASANSPYRIQIPTVEIRSVQILPDSLLIDVQARFVVE
jgi:hypothetical protein